VVRKGTLPGEGFPVTTQRRLGDPAKGSVGFAPCDAGVEGEIKWGVKEVEQFQEAEMDVGGEWVGEVSGRRGEDNGET